MKDSVFSSLLWDNAHNEKALRTLIRNNEPLRRWAEELSDEALQYVLWINREEAVTS